MDYLWLKILDLVGLVQAGLDILFAPLHALGPAAGIACIAAVTVLLAKLFSRYRTKRYYRLQEEFNHWFQLKQDVLKLRDEEPEKAKAMARSIDSSTLNKVYYDFFLEGLLNNLLTAYIPVMCMAAYVNDYYRPENLMAMAGRDYVLKLPNLGGGEPITVGAVFWFVLSLLTVYLLWTGVKRFVARRRAHAVQGAV